MQRRQFFWPEGLILPRVARPPPWPPPSLSLYTAAAIRLLGFFLDYSVENSFAAVSVCETPTHEFNHTFAIWLYSSLFLLVFFIALAEISLRSEVNRVVTQLITRGVVVLRLQDRILLI